MSANIRSTMSWLVVVAAVVGVAGQVLGQGFGRGPVRPETRGIVKAVDASAGTITVSVGEFSLLATGENRSTVSDKTYSLAKDVEVAVNESSGPRVFNVYKEGKLADLVSGATVTLALSADQKTVESIVAEGPVVRGLIKSVDAAGKTLTIRSPTNPRDQPAEEKTYALAADAEIAVDDGRGRRFSVKEGQLADLTAESLVNLRLSIDQKQVQSITAEGPNLNGVVKALDPDKKSLTVALGFFRGGEGAEEKIIQVSGDAVVLLDDGKGRRLSLKQAQLADVPVGSGVNVKLSADQTTATLIRAEGPNLPALIKSVDAKLGTITFATSGASGDDLTEKTLPVAPDVRIIVDGNQTKLEDIKIADTGPVAQVRLSLNQKVIQGIFVGRPR